MNVLVSSAGRRGALVQIFREVLHSLFGAGTVVAVDRSPLSAAGMLADHFEVVPPCDSDAFVPHMLDLCRRYDIGLLVPTIDPELAVYSAHRDRFAAIGTTVMVSAPQAIEISADKLRTFRWFTENSVPTVRTASLNEVLGSPQHWRPPWIVKPVAGSASSRVRRIDSWSELETLHHEPDLIVQEVAQGHEHTVDAWVDRSGRCRCVLARRRLEVRGGEVQKAVTIENPELQDLVRRVVEQLPGAYGALNVQVAVDGPTMSAIEINPRFGGGYPLSWQAGANFPKWTVEEVAGLPPTWADAQLSAGLAMLRYDEAVFVKASEVGL
ncbi:ATP-grasp domain-containing protein [Saccharopolyspora sp. NPDC050389]|uniref:ATP-grasp domain-containing protein n=1 Tax=Saccharopolyspora sp. NPDC050389 TaxID=3155516 RepID=UPI0033CAEE0B